MDTCLASRVGAKFQSLLTSWVRCLLQGIICIAMLHLSSFKPSTILFFSCVHTD